MLDTDELQAVVQSLPIALLTTNGEREIVGVNSAASALFGYHQSELLGQKIELLIPTRFAKNHPTLYQRFVSQPSNREMGAGRDLWALRKDGTEFPVEVALTVLNTSPAKYLASILDISYRKKTEELLRKQQQLLEFNLQETQATLEHEISEKTRLEERQRLGRELHDSLSQNLYGIGLGIRTALANVKKERDPTEPLNYCLSLTEASLVEMRALLFRLRPKSLENVPLADVLLSHTQAVSARTKLQIHFQVEGDPKSDLSFDKKYALYRIVTEALHNCVKHAKAKFVEVTLKCRRGVVEATVQDNGRGFDPEVAVAGHGLAGMRERAEAVDGKLQIASDAQGTVVQVAIPR
ncbi:MAG: PAS domain S-box protein [Candidatus Eremiobacteraeota bacterium]|nr:PAS domain S-box protein [Candidatus Eremiobacteraeota bacterium]